MRFLVVGGYNTVFGYVVFAGLYLLLQRRYGYLMIGLLAYSIALVNAFAAHRFLVFRASDSLFGSFARFNVSQLLVLCFGMLGLYVLVEYGRLNPLAAQALVILVSVVATYMLHRHFSFRNQSAEGGRPRH